MIDVKAAVYDLWRRLAGRYSIDARRPIAEKAPYTFFLPSENELLALQPGDLAKLIFRSRPPGREWDAERMWVTVTAAERDDLAGTLANAPSDMPQMKFGQKIAFNRYDVIDIVWAEERIKTPPPPAKRGEYWQRCMVDACVVSGRSPVDYLYREEPDLHARDDDYPDSGWRIRGTDEGIAEDEKAGLDPEYVAVGAVLNKDDSWLTLIDAPVGSHFFRDPDTGEFAPCSDR